MNIITRFLFLLVTVLFCIAGFRLMQVNRVVSQNKTDNEERLKSIDKKLNEIENRLDNLTAALNNSNLQENRTDSALSVKQNGTAAATSENREIARNRKELQELKEIISSTGLDQLAERGDIDPEILKNTFSEYDERSRIQAHRQTLAERNETQHELDRDRYDDELGDLYQL